MSDRIITINDWIDQAKLHTKTKEGTEDVKGSIITFPCWHNQKIASVKWKGLKKTILCKNKNDNVALLCGESTGITVVDIDAYKFNQDSTFIKAFTKRFIEKFNTYTVKTPSGGYHLYFHYNPLIRTSASSKHHIDIRNDGSYVVAPPSTINGCDYQVINNVKLQEAPTELIDYYHTTLRKDANIEPKIKNSKISKIETSKCNRFMTTFDLTASDWKEIINKKQDWANDYTAWIKVTIASKSLGFKDEWDNWSKKGTKYNQQNNKSIWNSITLYNEEATIKTIHQIMQPSTSNVKEIIEDKFYKKRHYRPVIDQLTGFTEIHRAKLDDITGTERFFKYNRNYLIKSDTGTGKTTAFRKMIKEEPVPFVSVVSRIVLGQEQFNDFKKSGIDAKFYQERDFKYGDSIIITPESIPMIANYDFSKYVFFFDEFNSIIEHVLQSTTLNKNRIATLRIILSMLRACRQFICVDADISEVAMKFLECAEVKFDFIKNTFQHFRNTEAIHFKDEQKFMNKLIDQEKYLVCCDSKAVAEIIDKRLRDAGHVNTKLITSDTDSTEHIDLDKYDRVIFSPKIIYGLDSTMERPVFCYYKGETILPPQMVQQVARCRNMTKLFVHFSASAMMSHDSDLDDFDSIDFTINENIAYCLKIFSHLIKMEKQMMVENGVIDKIENIEIDERAEAISANNEMIYDIYRPLQQLYMYKVDAYRTNVFLHFKNILLNRGFKFEENYEASTKIKDVSKIKKQIKSEKIENFDSENPVIKRRIDYLNIPSDEVDNYKDFILDNNAIRHHINYSNFFHKSEYDLLCDIRKRDDFLDKKTKSDKMTMLVVLEMLETLKLTKNDINYHRTDTINDKYKALEDKYNKTTSTSRKKKIETDIDVHKSIIEKYGDLFGFRNAATRLKYKKGEIRQMKINFKDAIDFHEKIRAFRNN